MAVDADAAIKDKLDKRTNEGMCPCVALDYELYLNAPNSDCGAQIFPSIHDKSAIVGASVSLSVLRNCALFAVLRSFVLTQKSRKEATRLHGIHSLKVPPTFKVLKFVGLGKPSVPINKANKEAGKFSSGETLLKFSLNL